MKLIYIAYGNVSVFDSQVVALLNKFAETKKFDEIILISGKYYNLEHDVNLKGKLNSKIILKNYQQYPQYFLSDYLTIYSIYRVLREIKGIDNYAIHVRNEVLGHYVYKALRILRADAHNLIIDIRGAGMEQLIEYSKKNWFILFLKRLQRKQVFRTLGRVRNISAVSKSLKIYLEKKVGTNSIIKVNSCLASERFVFSYEEREKIRNELRINETENLIVLASAGSNLWQNTENTIDSIINLDIKILNLSKTIIKHKQVINKFVPYNDMFKYLCAADVAIIWREKSITNKVASPVKFCEYMCCGLPVISNDSIDLIRDYLKDEKNGIILSSIDSIDNLMIDRLKSMDRFAIGVQGQKDFGINSISSQYIELYDSIYKSS